MKRPPKKPFSRMTPLEKTRFYIERSKKGWDTRRKKQINSTHHILENIGIVKGTKVDPKPRFEKLTRAELRQQLLQLQAEKEAAEAQLAEELITHGFVDTRNPEFLHSDGSIAVHPCKLRNVAEADRLRAALLLARRRSQATFDELARDMADFYDLPVKEVYTLFWSP